MTTSKQIEARQFNWMVFTVRGMYALVEKLDIPEQLKKELLYNIDSILVYFNVDTELTHRQKILKKILGTNI